MLFNSTVYQIGGGTHSIITVNIPINGSKSYEIPDQATMFCFGGWCNIETCTVIATRETDKNFHVEINRMGYYGSAAIEGNRLTLKAQSNSASSGIGGTLIYK
nr:MAG TPA: hypothetical protein [Caudoviricetes sp.]